MPFTLALFGVAKKSRLKLLQKKTAKSISYLSNYTRKNKGFVLVVVLLTASIGILFQIFYSTYQHSLQPSQRNEALSQVLGTTETIEPSVTPEISADLKIEPSFEVQFSPRELVDEFKQQERFELYRIGEMREQDKVTSLLLLKVTLREAGCTTWPCARAVYGRFLQNGSQLTYLPQISQLGTSIDELLHRRKSIVQEANQRVMEENLLAFLQKHGSIEIDDHFTIPQLTYLSTLSYGDATLTLATYPEVDGVMDEQLLTPVWTDSPYGVVYTTRSDLQDTAKERWSRPTLWNTIDSTPTCEAKECFLTNAFFIFRPDGTMLRYDYDPQPDPFQLDLAKDVLLADEYVGAKRLSCQDSLPRLTTIVSDEILNDTQMKKIGSWPGTQSQAIYAYLNFNHQFYQDFFNAYVQSQPKELYGDQLLGLRYDEFVRTLPVFFWKDAFGRLIQFTNTDYIRPLVCHSRITISTSEDKVVSFTMGDTQLAFYTYPSYHSGWSVVAKPNGKLTHLTLSQNYDDLVWEGMIPPLARPKVGYVIKREELSRFLHKTLPLYGLSDEETQTFTTEWLPQLTKAKYFQFGFYPKQITDIYAPITVEPSPDTWIRLLIDIRPLSREVPIIEPILPTNDQTTGLRVLEWSVVKR